MSFEKLSKKIQDVMKDAVPTEIQRIAIPKVLEGGNLLLIAPTGSGKTEAVMLPVLEKLAEMGESGRKGIRVLYITPLRALNRDMLRRMTVIAGELGISVAVRHGDTPQSERERQSKIPPQMLITTPETFQLLFLGRRLRKGLENVRWVIIDEIHELAEDERGAQLAVGLERLANVAGREVQRIGLSATVGTPEEIARFLSGAGRSAEIVSPKMSKRMEITIHSTAGGLKLKDDSGDEKENLRLLSLCRGIIEKHASTLFFVNTRDSAEWLAATFRMLDDGFPVGIHHGSLSKEVRVQMEDDFKAGHLKALICTSSLELGIDVGRADYVIQYNSPRQVTRIVQRVGRAGHRLDLVSEGVIISQNPDELLEACVIARNAMSGKYEETRIRKSPLSVLANQIVAISMAEGAVALDSLFRTITRAHPFRDLKLKELERVVETLQELREVRYEKGSDGAGSGEVRRGKAAMDYFFSNISMIPDEKTYLVRDVATRRPIGTLDENFVATYAEPELSFIVKGTSWRIVEIKDEEILVEQVKDMGALPSWVGEELPVPFEIAMGVGELRRTQKWADYPISPEGKERCVSYIGRQKGMPAADDKMVVIERGGGGRLFIVNACFGTRVNETLGRYLAAMLSAKFGESVGLDTDAYRISIELPSGLDAGVLESLLLTTKAENLKGIMRLVLRNTSLFRWQFLQVAKKFGVIEKGADFRAININRLIDAYAVSPVYEEALEKAMWEKMDIEGTARVLDMIQAGEIKVETAEGFSPVALAGLESRKELLVYGRADKAILNVLKERLLRTDMLLACLSCRASRKVTVSAVDERVKCWSCGSVLVAALRPYERETLSVLRKKSHGESDRKTLKRLQKSANIIYSSGRRGAMALSGRGIGPDTAARILERFYQNEDEFLKAILEAEITYAKTRRFWD